MTLGVLVSGNLGFKVLENLKQDYNVSFVMCDKKSNLIIEYCKRHNLQYYIGSPNSVSAFDFYNSKEIEVLVSANYLFLINEKLIKHPSQTAINIHGSLLPKYRGRTPHVWAIINGEKKAGITIHNIDAGCDTGDIIKQIEIKISDDDTGYTLLQKYQQNYVPLIMDVLLEIKENRYLRSIQNEDNATCFSKRTPDDGLINWNWQKERIKNWVRAQSNPYPGAFTFFNGSKVIIDEVQFSEIGYRDTDLNGEILKIEEGMPLVKTSNGVIRLLTIREQNYTFELNEILNDE